MVINWNQPGAPDAQEEGPRIPAAEYVRMSTDHQRYSTDNQAQAIREYAEARGYEIVKTYADEGKSGLNLGGRAALQCLLDDIESGRAQFKALIVYDISRLGRFQDTDEAASYEFRCRHAGVPVHYCTEPLENDGSIGSSIIKTVKRAMAGEYSRELSVKVFAGQANLIRLGFRQGGPAGFGLRRVLIDQDGRQKSELGRGEHKSIATDRVILVPGPDAEVKIVQDVYRLFVHDGMQEREIASLLNGRNILSDLDRPWTRGSIHQLLINEKYIGNNVWGRTSFKLKREHTRNSPEDWIRSDGAFAAIIDQTIFEKAQAIIAARSEKLSDVEMLATLKKIFDRNGLLSGIIIDEACDAPSSSAFRSRFGSLLRAYALVGFAPDRDYRYLQINRELRELHPTIVADVITGIEAAGGFALVDEETDILTINKEFTASVIIARFFQTSAGSLRWKVRLDTALNPDITVVARMNENNDHPKDFYILPRLDMRTALLRLAEYNGLSFDAYRFDDLSSFYRMAARRPLRNAA
ncbi:recombinase family protein [Sphingobium sp. PNB]|uniref:recombinase family protein n=1 Tax=Sphingobium sp. PNB TaxID=863934 RepID=UPI001CA3F271|nr:recombinase family protein [Sphingobium sp. PNB]MCB4863116.1 recombinase family protein [Sphingobium sp. PNB]